MIEIVSELNWWVSSVGISVVPASTDIAIIANNHPQLASWRPRQMLRVMAESGFIYDYWNHFSDLRPYELGPDYLAVGNTGQALVGAV